MLKTNSLIRGELKLKIILLLFASLLSKIAYPQQNAGNPTISQRDTIVTFYNIHGEKINTRDSAEYYRLVMSPDTNITRKRSDN